MKFDKNSMKDFPKGKIKKFKKFKCELCERIVVQHRHIKVRKNYPFGKKSKPSVTYIHRIDGGCLVELKKRKKDDLSTQSPTNRNN